MFNPFKKVDELFEVALGAHDQLAQLIELLFRGCGATTILQPFEYLFEFRDLAFAPEGVGGEQNSEHQEPGRNCPQPVGNVKLFKLLPG